MTTVIASKPLDLFSRRVLGCVSGSKRTIKEIKAYYHNFFPQGRIAKVFLPPVSDAKVAEAIHALVDKGLITSELTRFTDETLKEDTVVYYLSNTGRRFLNNPKKS